MDLLGLMQRPIRVENWAVYGSRNPRRWDKHTRKSIEDIVKTFDELRQMGVQCVICLDDKCRDARCENNGFSPSEKPYCIFTDDERRRLKPAMDQFDSYRHLGTKDPVDGGTLTGEYVEVVCDEIDCLRGEGKNVLVHCGAGINRTRTIFKAYLGRIGF